MNPLWWFLRRTWTVWVPAGLVVTALVVAWFEGRRSAFEEVARRDADRLTSSHEAIGRVIKAPDPLKELEEKRWLRD